MMGPTLWTTTIVFLLAAATACTSWLPLCQGSRFSLSPVLLSTVMYPSPESAVITTMAASAPDTAFDTLVLSESWRLSVVPSAWARVLSAS